MIAEPASRANDGGRTPFAISGISDRRHRSLKRSAKETFMTKTQQTVFLILMVLMLSPCGCSNKEVPAQNALVSDPNRNVSVEPQIITHPLDLADVEPIEFLTHLESDHKSDCCYYIRYVNSGWVKEEHLPHLFNLLDSDKKCSLPVFFASSPHVDMGGGSTVGREAAFLIKNYMGQKYPAPLGSRISDEDKEELRKWRTEHQKNAEQINAADPKTLRD